MGAGVLCALLLQVPGALAPPLARNALEREAWVRAVALAPLPQRSELNRALGDPAWVQRAAALEALRRAARVGTLDAATADELAGFAQRAVSIAGDAAAPERATALGLLAAWPRALELDDALLERAALGPPPVLLALVELLERLPAERGQARLESLCAHADGRVREAALGALAARGDAGAALARQLARLDPLAQREAWLLGLERLERQPLPASADAEALLALRAAMELRSDLSPGVRAACRVEIEAAFAVRHPEAADLQRLARGWDALEQGGSRGRELFTRAARAAHAAGLPLAELLLVEAERAVLAGRDPAAWLDGVLEADPRADWLARAAASPLWSSVAGVQLWQRMAGRVAVLPPAAAEFWLAPERDPQLRAAVLGCAAAQGEADWLRRALHDPDGELAAEAFRELAIRARAPDGDPLWIADLYASWLRAETEQHSAWLRWLPRGRDLGPFQADLARLGEEQPQLRAQCAELLGVPAADSTVQARLEAWLASALSQVSASEGSDREAERQALSVQRALVSGRFPGAAERIAESARVCAPVNLAVAKHALALLGGMPAGEPLLEPWLAAEAPRRLRIEAALQLAALGAPSAAEVLAETYPECAVDLRARSLRALADLPARAALELLASVAGDASAGAELRRLAFDGLARRGASASVLAALAGERDPEAVDAGLGALGLCMAAGDGAARAALLAELSGTASATAGDELAEARLESLYSALAAGGVRADELELDWLARARETARADLRARFDGRRLPAPTFRFRGELDLATQLAARGELAAELARSGSWWTWDARLLGQLASAAGETDPDAARTCLLAARIGLLGEGPVEDAARDQLELRRLALVQSEARRDWDLQARQLEQLLADWRAVRLDEPAAARWLGRFAPAAAQGGSDPRARLESALLQARAWRALAAGDAAAARELAAQASVRCGPSAAAREAQRQLEAALPAPREGAGH